MSLFVRAAARAASSQRVAAQRTFHTAACVRSEQAAPAKSASGPVLNLRFATSSELLVHRPVYMVTVPAVSGVMGVLGDHAPTIAQLKPGIVTVHSADMNDVTHRYFISGGFAVVKGDSSATVTAVEAIKPEDLDAGAARKALDDAQAALLKASTDREKAEAQIAIELNEAVLQAIEAKI